MAIIVNLDIMMARRKVSLSELAEKIDITPANLSVLKTGKAKAVRFSTRVAGLNIFLEAMGFFAMSPSSKAA